MQSLPLDQAGSDQCKLVSLSFCAMRWGFWFIFSNIECSVDIMSNNCTISIIFRHLH